MYKADNSVCFVSLLFSGGGGFRGGMMFPRPMLPINGGGIGGGGAPMIGGGGLGSEICILYNLCCFFSR